MVDVRNGVGGGGVTANDIFWALVSLTKGLSPTFTKPLLRLAVCSFFPHTPIDKYNYVTVGRFHM